MSQIKADGRVTFSSIEEFHRENDAINERIDRAMAESEHSPEGTDGNVHYDFSRAESLAGETEAEKVASLRALQREEAAQGRWYRTVGVALEAEEERTARREAAADAARNAPRGPVTPAGSRELASDGPQYEYGSGFRVLTD